MWGDFGVFFWCCEGSVGCAGTSHFPSLQTGQSSISSGRGALQDQGTRLGWCRCDAQRDIFCPWRGDPPFMVGPVSGPVSGVGNAILRWQKWKCFVLETLLRCFPANPRSHLARGGPQPWHGLATVSSAQTHSFASPKKKKRGKKRVCCLTFPSLSSADCDHRDEAKALPSQTHSSMGRSRPELWGCIMP